MLEPHYVSTMVLTLVKTFGKKILFIAIYRKSLTALVIGQSLDVCSDLRREER